jgi:hypothetical protein
MKIQGDCEHWKVVAIDFSNEQKHKNKNQHDTKIGRKRKKKKNPFI